MAIKGRVHRLRHRADDGNVRLAAVAFLFSPVLEIPSLREWAHRTLGHAGPVIGTWLSMIGLALIVLGWSKIHKATDLVTSGIYRFIRHPQYTGIFLFTKEGIFTI